MKQSLDSDYQQSSHGGYGYPPPYQQPAPQKNNILIVLLIALAFFSGYLFFKVQSLEKITTTAQAAAPAGNAQPQQPAEPTPNYAALPQISDQDHIRGNKNAQVVIVEYSDLECPFCKTFHPTMKQVMQDYGDKVAWVFRHYPLPFHPKAQKSAEAVECATELGGNDAFWKMTDTIYEKMPDLELSQLPDIASQIGLDQNQFKTCLDSGKYAKKISDESAGGTKVGVSGTPNAIIIGKNGKKEFVNGALPIAQLKPMIDKVLN